MTLYTRIAHRLALPRRLRDAVSAVGQWLTRVRIRPNPGMVRPSGVVLPGVYAPFWDHLAEVEAGLAAARARPARMTARDLALARVQADRLELERPAVASMLRSAVVTIEALESALRDMDDARQQAVDRLARERRAWMVDRYRLQRAA